MPERFKNIDRDTPLLLPPDLRDWVAQDDPVHFVIHAVQRRPLSAFAVNYKGCGDEQYPPHMMLALLIYSYANGIFSSRRIERATYRDIAVHYLTGNTHPDQDTLRTFRCLRRRSTRRIWKGSARWSRPLERSRRCWGFSNFCYGGRTKCVGNGASVCLAYNLRRLHRLGAGLELAAAD